MELKVKVQIIKDFLLENGYKWDGRVYKESGLIKIDDEELVSPSRIRLEADGWKGPVYVQYSLVDFCIHILTAKKVSNIDLSNKWMEYVLVNLDNKEENARRMHEWCQKCLVMQKASFESEKKKLMKQLEELEKENIDSCKELENTIRKCQNYIH